ncbi:hypothetical protein BSL78_29137 [Apostichopus japonicus]|uniref:Tectonic-1-3 N-terminal domain-containing protein n=1 Tax=Stichopus japonicus TaxID=307972 RepID=A0A2G8JE56_STIJA|nr:hypothetical protein BSL78_29137 [Apostichopus japonicus]
MRYSIRRYGSVVLVACMANSTQGNQYVPSTSAGPEATFVLDSGSVQLVPTVSNVRTPTFSAYLVLSDTLQPNEAPCPTDANSTCPTTEASPVSDAPNITQISPWTLLTSEFVFQEGEVFKVVLPAQIPLRFPTRAPWCSLLRCVRCQLKSSTPMPRCARHPVRGRTCSNAECFGHSGAFLGLQETELLNPAYVEVSPCPCDLYESKCDTDCCCDMDCSEVDISLFTCTEGVEGGDFSALPDYLCDSASLYRSDWWPFLCVQVSNSPHLGLYYNTIVGLKDISSFNSFKSPDRPTDDHQL